MYYKIVSEIIINSSAVISLYYKISKEKFEPEPGFEPRTPGFLALLYFKINLKYTV